MQLGQISVCDSIGYNIKSDEDKSRILKEIDENFNIKVIRRHHERFDEAIHVPAINNSPHLASLRTNGNPYFLYLTRFNFVNQCVLIDKKVQQGYFYPRMILIRLWFDDYLFENTLFEGEMVKQFDGTWTFLLNDLLALRNEPSTNVNLVRRVNKLYTILTEQYVPDDMDLCRLRVKRYFRCDNLKKMLIDFVPRLAYTCRGVYFTPLFLKQSTKLLNFDDSLVKKVVRTNYKGAGDFLLITDRDKLASAGQGTTPADDHEKGAVLSGCQTDACVSEPRSQQQHQQRPHQSPPPDGRGNSAPPPSMDTADQTDRVDRTFWVRHTRLPDVYELYKHPSDVGKGASEAQVACVPTMDLSRALREAFMFTGVTEVIPMRCVLHPRFKKWMPQPGICQLSVPSVSPGVPAREESRCSSAS